MGYVLIGVVVVAVYLVMLYNRMVNLKSKCDSAWEQIGIQCKRRHELIPNLVELLKGAMDHEKSTLEAVIAARARAVDARTPESSSAAEAQLTQALGRLFAVVENYPDLKSNQNVAQVHEEITHTENLIAFSRQHHNDVAQQYNYMTEAFPSVLIARQFGFTARGLFKADAASQEPVKISMKRS